MANGLTAMLSVRPGRVMAGNGVGASGDIAIVSLELSTTVTVLPIWL